MPPLARPQPSLAVATTAAAAAAAGGPADFSLQRGRHLLGLRENVSLPRGVEEAAAAAQRLSRLATTLGGRVVELRLHHDSEKPTLHKPHRAALEQLGFTIIDCPKRTHIPALSLNLAPTARPEPKPEPTPMPSRHLEQALDKKIIVDAVLYAVTRSAQRQRCGLLLLLTPTLTL